MKNLLSRWLETKHGRIRDVPIRIGGLVFHIPFDGEDYLFFKCRRCGRCCRGQRNNALMLTLGDIERLAKNFQMHPSKFIDKRCIFASTTEGKDVYPLMGLPPVKVQYIGCYLKRYEEENQETVFKPHPCQYVTKDNLCSIYLIRPITCRKFPYTTVLDKHGSVHAYYVDVPWSECEGYRTKRHIKRQWLSTCTSDLTMADKEIIESVKKGLMIITEIK